MLICFIWWARQELNLRSSPCQGDVITPRPRARLSFELKHTQEWFWCLMRQFLRFFHHNLKLNISLQPWFCHYSSWSTLVRRLLRSSYISCRTHYAPMPYGVVVIQLFNFWYSRGYLIKFYIWFKWINMIRIIIFYNIFNYWYDHL